MHSKSVDELSDLMSELMSLLSTDSTIWKHSVRSKLKLTLQIFTMLHFYDVCPEINAILKGFNSWESNNYIKRCIGNHYGTQEITWILKGVEPYFIALRVSEGAPLGTVILLE